MCETIDNSYSICRMIQTHLITVQGSRVKKSSDGDDRRSDPKITDEVDLKVAKFVVAVQISRTK